MNITNDVIITLLYRYIKMYSKHCPSKHMTLNSTQIASTSLCTVDKRLVPMRINYLYIII